eukprot:761602-Hanusia_phi.AAC.3
MSVLKHIGKNNELPAVAIVNDGAGWRVGLAYCDNTLKIIGVCEFLDGDQLTNLEAALVRLGTKECVAAEDKMRSAVEGKKLREVSTLRQTLWEIGSLSMLRSSIDATLCLQRESLETSGFVNWKFRGCTCNEQTAPKTSIKISTDCWAQRVASSSMWLDLAGLTLGLIVFV